MTDALNPTVPAGWYPDPWGSTSQRWWDGTAWTGNLYPQPESQQKPDEPAPAVDNAGNAAPSSEPDYEPVAVRSTYEPASAYRTAAAPTIDSPYPSRRALRELSAEAPHREVAAPSEEAAAPDKATAADAPPVLTRIPEFSPEPVSVMPPPVWTDPEPSEAELPTPAAEPAVQAPAPTASPTARETAATGDADDGWAASLARWDDVETSSALPDSMPVFGDAPPVSYSQRASRYQPLHGRTSPVWLIVFIPILQAASVFGSVYLFPGHFQFDSQFGVVVPTIDPTVTLLSLRDWLVFAAIPLSLAFFLFTLVLGFQDRARLRLLGHDQTASPWWIVLSPLVYLIVRSVRVRQCTGRRGSGALTTYICLYIAPPVALFVAQAVTSALYGAIPV